MKKGIKKKSLILPLFILVLLAVNVILISAAVPAWVKTTTDFLKMGDTWEEVFITIFLLLIIAAGTYDILGVTMFRSPAVKALIGIGLAGILSVVGFLRAINTWIFAFAGEATALAIGGTIVIGAIAFFLIHIGFSQLAVRMEKAAGKVEGERAYTDTYKKARRLKAEQDALSAT